MGFLYFHCRPTASTTSYLQAARASSTADAAAASAAVKQPGLLFGRGAAGAWDDAGVAHPVVRFFGDGDACRWFMWYSGRSASCPDLDAVHASSGSVGVAVSPDGVHWQRGDGAVAGARGAAKAGDVGRVLAPNADAWWAHDTCHLHASDVQLLSNAGASTQAGGVYWMFYSGGSFEGGEPPAGLLSLSPGAGGPGAHPGAPLEGLLTRPGLAMSQDGRNWARIEAGHHSGALFDVGAPGEWDALFVGAPQVRSAAVSQCEGVGWPGMGIVLSRHFTAAPSGHMRPPPLHTRTPHTHIHVGGGCRPARYAHVLPRLGRRCGTLPRGPGHQRRRLQMGEAGAGVRGAGAVGGCRSVVDPLAAGTAICCWPRSNSTKALLACHRVVHRLATLTRAAPQHVAWCGTWTRSNSSCSMRCGAMRTEQVKTLAQVAC